MQARTAQILDAAVREFIRDGKPVSSLELYRNRAFGVKPATIRAELNRLTDAGYLAQRHISGGRVPTDKGYEAFVKRLLVEGPLALSLDRTLIEEVVLGAWQDFVGEVSRKLRLLSIGYAPRSGNLYRSGLEHIFDRLEVEEKDELTEIVRNVEHIGERLEALAHADSRFLEDAGQDMLPRVFIGRKSPLTTSEHLSVVVDGFSGGPRRDFLFVLIGPKRMDYQRSVAFCRMIKEHLTYDE